VRPRADGWLGESVFESALGFVRLRATDQRGPEKRQSDRF
jgi:hypothetical protein